jgi:ABC-type nitrate/sulfonate/bicarbonate transport system substrate-binding protein
MLNAVRALAALAVFFGAQFGTWTSTPAAAAEAKIALNFTWQAVYMPLRYGEAKGYFKEANLTLDVTPLQGSNQAMQLIEAGKVDYAFVDSDTFLALAAQGKTDSTAIYVWLDKPTLDVVSITPLPDLRALSGKSFGTTGFSAGRTALPYILKANGIDPKTVDVQAFDFSVLYPSFFRGAIDTAEIRAPGSWQNLLAQGKDQGKTLHLLRLSDYGLDGYDKILLTRKSTLQSAPGEVKNLVQALHRSVTQALANATDDETYDLLKEMMPQARKAAVIGDWHDYKDLVKKPGPIDPKVFVASLTRLNAVGTISQIPAVDGLYRNQIQ